MVPRSCSQTTSVIIGFSAHKQWFYCSIVPAYQANQKPGSTKILIVFIIKEDSHHEFKYYRENKASSIPMGIQNAKNALMIQINREIYKYYIPLGIRIKIS